VHVKEVTGDVVGLIASCMPGLRALELVDCSTFGVEEDVLDINVRVGDLAEALGAFYGLVKLAIKRLHGPAFPVPMGYVESLGSLSASLTRVEVGEAVWARRDAQEQWALRE